MIRDYGRPAAGAADAGMGFGDGPGSVDALKPTDVGFRAAEPARTRQILQGPASLP